MSDRSRPIRRLAWSVAGFATMATTMAAPLRAQASSPEAGRLAARARALADTLQQLKAANDALLATARDTLRDTVRVGPFTIATDPQYVGIARAGAESALVLLRPFYGDSRIRAGALNAIFIVRADSTRRLLYWERFARMSTRVGTKVENDEVFGGVTGTTSAPIVAYLAGRVRAAVEAATDTPLRRWAMPPAAGADVANDVFAGAFLQLQTGGSIPARDCSAGVLSQCVSALGLLVPAEPIDRIFTAAERREVGRRLFERRRANYGIAPDAPNPCTDRASESGCEQYIRSLPPGAIPSPMGMETRRALILTALTLGGAGALDRLLADSTTPLTSRLAAAAGVERDTLLARWRTRVLASRPKPVLPSTGVAVAALAWGIGFAGLALRLIRVG